MEVGVNDKPFLRSCKSCGLSDLLLRLCIPKSGLVEVFGLSTKNDLSSVVFWLGAALLCFYVLLSWGLSMNKLGSYPLMLFLSLYV